MKQAVHSNLNRLPLIVLALMVAAIPAMGMPWEGSPWSHQVCMGGPDQSKACCTADHARATAAAKDDCCKSAADNCGHAPASQTKQPHKPQGSDVPCGDDSAPGCSCCISLAYISTCLPHRVDAVVSITSPVLGLLPCDDSLHGADWVACLFRPPSI